MAGESSKSKAPAALDLDGHNLPPSPAPSTPRNGRKYALMTELVYLESTDQYNASSVPIYQVWRPFYIARHELTTAVRNFQTKLGHRWRRRVRLHAVR
jgi:hypothetical protein